MSVLIGPSLMPGDAEEMVANLPAGTTELPIMEAVPDFPQLKYVLGLHESVVVAMADGYARASNRLAAANVHVAPGLGNAMGALTNARYAHVPLVLLAGQQIRRRDAGQHRVAHAGPSDPLRNVWLVSGRMSRN